MRSPRVRLLHFLVGREERSEEARQGEGEGEREREREGIESLDRRIDMCNARM
jgi:hypothetical protein